MWQPRRAVRAPQFPSYTSAAWLARCAGPAHDGRMPVRDLARNKMARCATLVAALALVVASRVHPTASRSVPDASGDTAPVATAAPPDAALQPSPALAPGATDVAVPYDALGVAGDLFVHEHFRSPTLGERRIFVFLPSEYELFDEHDYPVLYVLDAQNYFDPKIAAGGEEWALDELLVQHPEGVSELVVVGIQASAQSVLDYSPPGSTPEARGAQFVRFLCDELKPFIDARYRTRAERASTWIVGQGSSAVLALYAAWVRGDTFAGAIALDFPDADDRTMAWSHDPPVGGRPWYWLEQSWTERSRTSTTQVVAVLQRHAATQVAVTSYDTHRAARILAALRAMPVR